MQRLEDDVPAARGVRGADVQRAAVRQLELGVEAAPRGEEVLKGGLLVEAAPVVPADRVAREQQLPRAEELPVDPWLAPFLHTS